MKQTYPTMCSLVNNTNRCNEFQFYWCYDSTCFGQPFCSSSGVLQFHPTPGSIRSSQLHKMYQSRCTAKNCWWWAERLPETCRVVIPIKLEFSASVGFIHKESVTMHGYMVVKKSVPSLYSFLLHPSPTHEVICIIQLHPVHVQCKLSVMSHKLKCDVNQAQNSNKICY